MIFRKLMLLILNIFFMTVAKQATALCLNGKISLAEEYTQSSLIATAVLIREQIIVDSTDPQGIAATRYYFSSKTIYKGNEKNFSVLVENTSSRIIFEKGFEYLVFVQQLNDDAFIDSCGNSVLVKEGGDTIEWLKRKVFSSSKLSKYP